MACIITLDYGEKVMIDDIEIVFLKRKSGRKINLAIIAPKDKKIKRVKPDGPDSKRTGNHS